MKTLKFFIILFMLLCVSSLGVTIYLTFLRENEKEKRIAAEEEVSILEEENTGLLQKKDSLEEEKKSLNKKLSVQTKLARDLKSKVSSAERKAKEAEKVAKEAEGELDKVREDFNQYKESSSNILDDYKEQNQDLLNKIREIEALMEGVPQGARRPGDYGEASAPPSQESVVLEPVIVKSSYTFSGKVLVVNRKFNFIISNIGKKDGLEIGDTLFIYRDGSQIATVRVEKLYEALSASGIVQENAAMGIQEGDTVGN